MTKLIGLLVIGFAAGAIEDSWTSILGAQAIALMTWYGLDFLTAVIANRRSAN
jgi:hypothetical protein